MADGRGGLGSITYLAMFGSGILVLANLFFAFQHKSYGGVVAIAVRLCVVIACIWVLNAARQNTEMDKATIIHFSIIALLVVSFFGDLGGLLTR